MAVNTDKFRKGARRFSTTLSSSITSSDATIGLIAYASLPTDTAIEITIDRVDSSGTLTPLLEEVVVGVMSGSNLTTSLRGEDGTTAQDHAAGASVEIRLTANQFNDEIDGILEEHEQDGSHSAGIEFDSPVLTTPEIIAPIIKSWDEWQSYTGTMPVFSSTTDGVDTLTLTDADTFLQKGTKLEITSDTGTYNYYVVDVTSTNFKVIGEAVVTGTITAMKYSYADAPFGFNIWMNWTPTYSASAAMTFTSVTTNMAKFRVIGDSCQIRVYAIGTTGGTSGTTISATTPIPVSTDDTSVSDARDGFGIGDTSLASGVAFVSSTDNTIGVKKRDNTVWSLGTGRSISGIIIYNI